GGVGLVGTISHAETEIFGVVDQGYQSGGGVVQLAIGPEMRLWRNLHLLGEYKFTRTTQRLQLVNSQTQSLFQSHHGIAGFSWHFGDN
ncbi:MAG: hypothetical protein AB7O65_09575, partial [Candidatus Korobacteraceae bacterium]